MEQNEKCNKIAVEWNSQGGLGWFNMPPNPTIMFFFFFIKVPNIKVIML